MGPPPRVPTVTVVAMFDVGFTSGFIYSGLSFPPSLSQTSSSRRGEP